MEYKFTQCPGCQINVGFLTCVTCTKNFKFVEDFCPKYQCPRCEDKPHLKLFIQDDHESHQRCWKNLQRMYYWCQDCKGHFCPCVEKTSSTIILKPCPFKKRQIKKDEGIVFGFE